MTKKKKTKSGKYERIYRTYTLDDGRIVGLPDEDTHMYSIELRTGNIIKCTEHYIQKSKNVS